jgi:hypothetical protein
MAVRSLIALLLILALVSGQDWQGSREFNTFDGGRLEHLESSVIRLNKEDSGNVNFTEVYSYPLTEGVFNSNENFYIATGTQSH